MKKFDFDVIFLMRFWRLCYTQSRDLRRLGVALAEDKKVIGQLADLPDPEEE